jgi:sugar/nucleoside kinase (ribokinase family)
VFIDLADPAKRTDEDLRRAMALLGRMNGLAPVTLGLNLAEAERLSAVYGLRALEFGGTLGEAVERGAAALRQRLALACVVVHPREGAGAAALVGEREEHAWFDGPFTRSPVLSTGAGDHFNGGFALARAMGWPLDESLALGCAASGAYVRDGASPSKERAVAFLRSLPQPEIDGG